jgi:hypothetical protein
MFEEGKVVTRNTTCLGLGVSQPPDFLSTSGVENQIRALSSPSNCGVHNLP